MTKIQKGAGAAGVAILLSLGAYLMTGGKHDKTPGEAIRDMKFPKGSHLTGEPSDGSICHELWRQYPDGHRVLLKSHRIMRDFRKAKDDAQRAAWIVEDTLSDAEDSGLACNQGDPGFYFQDAVAQPHCNDCGGGCGGMTCPGTFYSPGCAFGGTTCAITVICCGGGNCSCEP